MTLYLLKTYENDFFFNNKFKSVWWDQPIRITIAWSVFQDSKTCIFYFKNIKIHFKIVKEA